MNDYGSQEKHKPKQNNNVPKGTERTTQSQESWFSKVKNAAKWQIKKHGPRIKASAKEKAKKAAGYAKKKGIEGAKWAYEKGKKEAKKQIRKSKKRKPPRRHRKSSRPKNKIVGWRY